MTQLGRACAVAAALLVLLLASATARAAPSDNMLAGRLPSQSEGARRAEVLTDGIQPANGIGWNTGLSAVLAGHQAFVEYDLGRTQLVDSIYLQADNNDAYVVSASVDGRVFSELWVATPTEKSGMRPRLASALGVSARYLRLSATGGDGAYAVGELQVFSSRPRPFPPQLESRTAPPTTLGVRNSMLTFGLALVAFAALFSAELPWYLLVGLALVPVSAAVSLVRAIGVAWPLENRELSLLRAVLAAVALLVLVRERLGRRRYPACRPALNATLAVAAILSAASFYDLGHPQFWNAQQMRPEFVHQADMRVYYPFAKYFDELGYDGVYQASIAAYVEDVPNATLESLRGVEIRNLKDHRLERVAAVAPEISRISERFTPERWTAFKADMRYFRETMGDHSYLSTHSDHGANATPLWVALARPWLAFTTASERALTLGGLLDPLLLGVMFAVMGLTFGVRSMLLAVVVFGATDLYMFGTNWGGATLRHDWIAYLGLGACALKRERWVLGGVLLGLSVMIRAFPALALVGVGAAGGIGFLERWWRERRPPGWRRHCASHQEALRVLAGAAACVAVSLAVTGGMFGFDRWVEWFEKVMLLDSDIGTNDVSLRALVAFGNEQAPAATLRARWPLYLTLLLSCSGVVALVTARLRPHQAALLALPLIVVVFNPANYYVHFIALLPLLGSDASAAGAARRDAPTFSHLAISGPLLALCVTEYWTVLDPDFARHFQYETLLTFGALGWMYVNVARRLWPALGEGTVEVAFGASRPETPMLGAFHKPGVDSAVSSGETVALAPSALERGS